VQVAGSIPAPPAILEGCMLEQIQGKHILIDGDIVAYRCAASAEKTKYLVEAGGIFSKTESHAESLKLIRETKLLGDPEPLIWSRKEVQPLEFALQACKTAIDALLDKLSPSAVSVFLSPDRTFRHDIARTRPYKGNRVQPKPKYLKEVKEYLVKQYGATFGNNIEADDEIGTALSKEPDQCVSISIDKDLLQVPGWHYNWVNDTVQRISSKQGDFNFYTQMLQGDVTDNVPGIAGIGEVGARKILHGAGSSKELCSRVWSCYRGEFNDAEKARNYFLEQAQLLYILRYNPEIPGKAKQYSPPIPLNG
jgi:5'-3' exonuclease